MVTKKMYYMSGVLKHMISMHKALDLILANIKKNKKVNENFRNF